jgi:hypothetical protein
MSKFFKIVKIFLIICISIFLLVILFFKFLDLIFNKYSDKLVSPDGKYYAQVAETNGGATTGFISGVMIVNANPIFSISNRLSNLIGNSKGVFASNGSGSSIKLSWLDKRTLKITFSDCDKIYGQDKSWKDIKIIYEGKCSQNN